MTVEEVRHKCLNCGMCNLSETGSAPVPGEGPDDAEVMFVDEYPEPEDIEPMRPMTGEAGKLLQCYLEVIGLYRGENLYITTLTKCRPPENRNPDQGEREICIQILREEFRAVRPKIVICAGRTVGKTLIKPDFFAPKESGVFFHKGKTIFVGVPRPSDLLRNPRAKADAFDYYAAIRAKIGEVCEHTYPPDFLLSHDEKKRLKEKPAVQEPQEQKVRQMTLV